MGALFGHDLGLWVLIVNCLSKVALLDLLLQSDYFRIDITKCNLVHFGQWAHWDPLPTVDLCKKSGILLHGRFISPLLFINLLSHSFVAAVTHRYFILWVITQYHLILCPGFGRFSPWKLFRWCPCHCAKPFIKGSLVLFLPPQSGLCIYHFLINFFTSGTAFSQLFLFILSLPHLFTGTFDIDFFFTACFHLPFKFRA